MDDELKAYLDALMDDLVGKIILGNERILNRLTALEGEVRNLRSEHSVTRDLVAALPATVLRAVEKPFLSRLREIEDRVTKIEDKP